MKVFNKSYIPSIKRHSSVQVPYFFHTINLYPYQVKESSIFLIDFEKMNIILPKEKSLFFVNENFVKDLLSFKNPRESLLICFIPEEEKIYKKIEKVIEYLNSIECGVSVIWQEEGDFPSFENLINLFSLHNFVFFNKELKEDLKINAFLYPLLPGFSDEISIWEEHLSCLKKYRIKYIYPYTILFDSNIKILFEISKGNPKVIKKIEEVIHQRSRKEYYRNLWQKFLPFLRKNGYKILYPLPKQAGELYENRILSQRAFFLWHYLLIMERDIEAWQFHRLAFKLWRLPYPIRDIYAEKNLSIFELNILEDYLKGEKYIYPDEELWL